LGGDRARVGREIGANGKGWSVCKRRKLDRSRKRKMEAKQDVENGKQSWVRE